MKLYSLKFVRMFKIVPTPMPWPAGGKRFLSHAKGPGATWPACPAIASHALDGFCPLGCQRTLACCVVLLVFRRPYRRHPCTSEPEVISTVQTALALGSTESLRNRCRHLCPVPRLPRSSLERVVGHQKAKTALDTQRPPRLAEVISPRLQATLAS